MVKEPFDFRIPPAHGVAHDDLVRREPGQSLRVKTLQRLDACRGEDLAHRRIRPAVGAQYFMTLRPQQERGIAHGCAADAH